MKKLFILILLAIASFAFAKENEINYAYLDSTQEFQCFIPDATEDNISIIAYFPVTDSSIVILNGDATFRSNTLTMNEISTEQIMDLIHSDAMFNTESTIIVDFKNEW